MKNIYDIKTSKRYERDVKLAIKRGLNIEELIEIVRMLHQDEALPERCHNHLLHGDYKGYWECHINPDWLLIYEKDTEIHIISLYRTGSHADLFGKGKKR
jgi:mRNA interferase YafQ